MKDSIREYLNSEENYSIFERIDDKIIDPLRFFQLLELTEKICLNIDLPHIVKEKYYSFLSLELPRLNDYNGNDFKIVSLLADHLTCRLEKRKSEDWRFKKIIEIPFRVKQDIVEKNVFISIPKTASLQNLNSEIYNERQYSSSNDQLDIIGKIEKIVSVITESCIAIIDSPEYFKTLKKHSGDLENQRTWLITNKFSDKASDFSIENQHSTGQSGTMNSTGTVDFAVSLNNKKIVIGEALNFSGQNTERLSQNIIKHLHKLIANYNHSKLCNLFFLVYCEGSLEKFYMSYQNYLKHFGNCTQLGFEFRSTIEDITSAYVFNSTAVKIAKSIHSYSNNSENQFSIYHFYIYFS